MNIKLLSVIAKILKRLPLLNKVAYRFNVIRHNLVLRKLNKKYKGLINEYKQENKFLAGDNDTVWVFWWQGIDSAPKIVKSCVRSIERHLPQGKKLVIIDKYNLRDYTDISNHIYIKLDSGVITYTHFSDIVRFNLLKNHGGLWIDATVYLVHDLSAEYFEDHIFTNGPFNDEQYFNVANGQWSGFFFGGPSKNELFNFMDAFFDTYWKNETKLIDYFLIDYLLAIASENNIGGFKEYLKRKKPRNIGIFMLEVVLNNSFDSLNYQKMINNNDAFKLNYKKSYRLINKGIETFYGKVIDNEL